MPNEKMITVVCDDNTGFYVIEMPLSEYENGIKQMYERMKFFEIGNIKIWYDPQEVDIDAPNVREKIREFEDEHGNTADKVDPVELTLTVCSQTGEVYILQ